MTRFGRATPYWTGLHRSGPDTEMFVYVGNESNPNNVYLAFPGSDFEIEVFDPAEGEALEIATSGAVRPIQ